MEEERMTFEAAGEDAGKRLDAFLTERFAGSRSRTAVQRLIDAGKVRIAGQEVKRRHALRAGDFVDVTVPPPAGVAIAAEDIPIDVVYEDADLLVVNKSADMVVHPAPGNWTGTLVNALMARCKDLSGVGGKLKPGIVHRLDKGTTGLLVVAKNDRAHRRLSKQFQARGTTRRYTALVRGIVRFDNGVVDAPLGRSSHDRKKVAVDPESERHAVTRYHVIERFSDATLLELRLETGRTHQIRVHMAHIGHPVIGDELYGCPAPIGRPALHARTIGFVHPSTGEYREFTSELPEDMTGLIAARRKDHHEKNPKTRKGPARRRHGPRR